MNGADYILDGRPWRVATGNCLDVLQWLPDNSVDSVVTDPPYGLSFMGRRWDYDVPSVEIWAEVLRVLKPGGYLLAFFGTRTYHRGTARIEDAGFEIRDMIEWFYGSGFPKSLDVSKAMDKTRDDREEILKVTSWIAQARDEARLTNAEIDAAFDFVGMAGHWTTQKTQPTVPTPDQAEKLFDLLGIEPPEEIAELVERLNDRKRTPGEAWHDREVVGTKTGVDPSISRLGMPLQEGTHHEFEITAPATEDAERWEGWGTALKPGHEPIVMARKPFRGPVAPNLLEWGTGAINVDGCRVYGPEGRPIERVAVIPLYEDDPESVASAICQAAELNGRWPPNVVLSHSVGCGETCIEGCPVLELGRQSGESTSPQQVTQGGKTFASETDRGGTTFRCAGDTGTAARFFPAFRYIAKPSRAEKDAGISKVAPRCILCRVKERAVNEGKADRICIEARALLVAGVELDSIEHVFDSGTFSSGAQAVGRKEGSAGLNSPRAGAGRTAAHVANDHPTVKPIDLMRWAARLVTPPGGVVLDPFNGSGTTGCGAVLERLRYIGIEMDPDSVSLSDQRIAYWENVDPNYETIPKPKPKTEEEARQVDLVDMLNEGESHG